MKNWIKNKCEDLTSFIKVNYYNIKNINDQNSKKDIYFATNNDTKIIYLMGKIFSMDKFRNYLKVNDNLNIIFKNLYTFLYEKNISKEIKTDIGWGCTFRCGQMFLFYFLKKNYNFSKKTILNFFSNEKCNYFSLYSFVNHAKVFFEFKIGDYSSIYSFFIYLSNIHKIYKLNYFDEIIISKNDTIFLNEVNNNLEKKLIVFNISINIKRDSENIKKDWKRIFSNKYFYGMFGGINKSCYYIIGLVENYFYYLDPHSIYNKNKRSNLFIKKEIINKFTNNFGIIFYTKNEEEFTQLIEDIGDMSIINFLNITHEEELLDLNCSFENNEFVLID